MAGGVLTSLQSAFVFRGGGVMCYSARGYMWAVVYVGGTGHIPGILCVHWLFVYHCATEFPLVCLWVLHCFASCDGGIQSAVVVGARGPYCL